MKHFALIVFVSGLFGCICLSAEQIPFSFDSLFPSSWYEKAYNSSMSAWSNLDSLYKTDLHNTHPEHHAMVFDATLGRLVYAQYCLEQMRQDLSPRAVVDDIMYLSNVMDKIEQTAQEKNPDERMACLHYVIQNIKMFLAEKF